MDENIKSSRFRQRRKKGELSVFEEFNDNAPATIIGTLKVDSEIAKNFEERAKIVDAPVEVRLQLGVNQQTLLPDTAPNHADQNLTPPYTSYNGEELRIDESKYDSISESFFLRNLEKTQRKPRENLEKTQRKPRENLEIEKNETSTSVILDETNQHQSSLSSESPDNLETQRKPRENLEKTQRKPRENLEIETCDNLETQRKPRDKPRDEPRENLEKTQRKPRDRIVLSNLVGLQRKLILFLYEETKQARDRMTQEISSNHLAEVFQAPVINVQNVIKELVKKQVIKRVEFKVGRGGWTRYEICESIYHQLTVYEANTKPRENLEKTQRKPREEPRDKPRDTSPSSSSSSYINEKLTTTEQDSKTDKINSELPPEWQEIDFSELTELGIPFGQPHLKQWYDRKYCTSKEAQESIWHFGFYLKNSKKETFKTGPLNFFMGVMAKSHYFSQPEGYLSPEEIALKQSAEDMKKRSENLKRLQEEFFLSAFEIWFNSLSGSQIKALVPHLKGLETQKSCLRQMFRDAHFITIKDNPSIDVTQLVLNAPTQEDFTFSKKEQELKNEIEWLKEILIKHPRDEDSRAKLRDTEAMLISLRQSTSVV